MMNKVCQCKPLKNLVQLSKKLTLDFYNELWYCVVLKKGVICMSQKRLLTNGNAFKRTDNRWCGVVWYMDERGVRKRKSFSGTTKQAVNKKITDYIADFKKSIIESQETKKTLRESMQKWLEVFKFPSVERSTYDRYECTAKNQIYPVLGDKVVSDISAADIKDLLNQKMSEGYAYTTVKKVYVVLGEYFRYLTQQEILVKHPSLRHKPFNYRQSCSHSAQQLIADTIRVICNNRSG